MDTFRLKFPLMRKTSFLADGKVFVSPKSRKHVTTQKKKGVKYKKISNFSMGLADLRELSQESLGGLYAKTNDLDNINIWHLDVAISDSWVLRGDIPAMFPHNEFVIFKCDGFEMNAKEEIPQ